MARRKEISTDIRQFDQMLELVPEDRKVIARHLVKEIIFMAKTLDELKQTVSEQGTVEMFTQGKNSYLRESPALKGYNATIQRYSTLYRQFADLLPKQGDRPADSALMDFVKQG